MIGRKKQNSPFTGYNKKKTEGYRQSPHHNNDEGKCGSTYISPLLSLIKTSVILKQTVREL